ncbi:hypothetical protein L7F22_012388 [Adiantum nelumboides]|nr:hypothetical protein [Adiantum nelumboides]
MILDSECPSLLQWYQSTADFSSTGSPIQFFSAAPMASGKGQSNLSTSGDASGNHNEDYGNEYGPPLPTQEELREMEHRRLVGEATNMMLNFAKDPKLAKYMTETAFQDVHAQWKATTTSPLKTDSKKQYSEKELEQEVEARLAEIFNAHKKDRKHGKKQKKSTDFPGYLGRRSTFDKAKKHKKHAEVPSSSSSSSDSSSDSSEEERKGKKRSKEQRHGKGKKKTRKSKSRRVDDSSTEDTSTDSSDSEDGHFYKKNFYKANQYDFLEDKSKKVPEMPLPISADTLMHSQVVLDEDTYGTEVADRDRLAHIVHVLSAFGSLMSDLLVLRPDLAYAVGAFAVEVVIRAMTDTGIVHSGILQSPRFWITAQLESKELESGADLTFCDKCLKNLKKVRMQRCLCMDSAAFKAIQGKVQDSERGLAWGYVYEAWLQLAEHQYELPATSPCSSYRCRHGCAYHKPTVSASASHRIGQGELFMRLLRGRLVHSLPVDTSYGFGPFVLWDSEANSSANQKGASPASAH